MSPVSESEPANDADLADGEHSLAAVHARGQGELGLGPPVGGVVGGGHGHRGGHSRVRWLRSVAPLALRAYRLLWIGQTVSAAGDALVQVALVFAILHVGGTASDIGYVAAIQTVTRVAFILAGGVWADRLRRQFVMLASDVLRAAVQAGLAVLLVTGQAHVWQLGLGGAIYGAAQSFFGPASAGLVPETVPAGQLQQANALMSFSGSFFSVGGPAAAGILVAVLGPGLVFAIDAATFVVSAVSLGVLPLLALAPPLATWEIAIAAALGGAGLVFLNSVWAATMQELIPDQVRSRVDSYDWLISLVVMPAGFAIIGRSPPGWATPSRSSAPPWSSASHAASSS